MMLYNSGSIVARSASDRFLAWRGRRLKALPHHPLGSCTANHSQQIENGNCMRSSYQRQCYKKCT